MTDDDKKIAWTLVAVGAGLLSVLVFGAWAWIRFVVWACS